MNKNVILSGVVGLLAGAGLVAGVASAGGDKKPADAKQPAMPADMQAQMAEYMKIASPGEHHKRLTANVGQWKGTIKSWMAPGMPPTESPTTSTGVALMDGRFVKIDVSSTFDMGPMGKMPFTGMGLYGYNNATKKYEAAWCDSMGTMMMFMSGEASPDGKTITWVSQPFKDPMTGKDVVMREIDRQIDDNTMVLEMHMPGPDGKEFKMMEITYSREGAKK